MEDEEGLEGFMQTNDEKTFLVLEENDAFIARRRLGGISDSRREKEKEHRQAKRAVTNEVASNPFEKVALAGRPIWPAKTRIHTTSHIGEKAKETTMAKEKADKKKENPRRSQPSQRRRRSSPPFSRLHHP